MNIKINSLHFKTDQKLDDFIESKVGKLYNLFDNITSSEVNLKVDKDKSHENKIAEIRLDVPGADIYAKKVAKTFEESTDLAVEALRKQLIRHKERLKN
ncbi:MAG: ribosome-associated translation inhibitor RaiA [Bacteroidales bacterium]|nr:ribosome-associated translation inhibitor RaiA [Bacteroidales bacterium]